MQAPDSVETILARLMPPALSQDCQDELEAMIDDIAGPDVVEVSPVNWTARWVIGGGIAAVFGGLCAVLSFYEPDSAPKVAKGLQKDSPSGLVLVSESDRIESMIDEGWREDANGAAIHAVRLSVVEENQLRDQETGMVVRISEPREEVLLMPIDSFEATAKRAPFGSAFTEAAVLPGASAGPTRIVDLFDKTASFTADEGTATVHREGDVYKIKIQNPQQGLIYEGELSKDGGLDLIPETWRRKIQVLCRTLDQALDGKTPSERQPRARVVPPPYSDR